jgi:hypothetical protein
VYDKSIAKITCDNQRTLLDSVMVRGSITGFALDSIGYGWVAIKDDYRNGSKILSIELSSGKVRTGTTLADSGISGGPIAAADGSIWCAFNNGSGIVQWTPASGYKHFNTQNSVLYSNDIKGLEAGPDSSVWIGDGGLVRYKSGEWTRFDSSWTGLPGKNCMPLAVEHDGKLWAAVYRTELRPGYTWSFSSSRQNVYSKPAGIACYDGQTWTQYTTLNSGLLSNTVDNIAVMDGTVYISANGGLSIFRPNPSRLVNPPGDAPFNKTGASLTVAIDKQNVRFALMRPGAVFFSVFDCKGRLIAACNAGQLAAGTHVMPMTKLFNGQETASEMLLLKVSTENGSHVEHRIPYFNW